MSHLDKFDFETRQDLVKYLFASPLAHPKLKLGGSTYKADGRIPILYANQVTLHCVTHEAGHMLDFFMRGQLDRLATYGFGFSYPETWVFDRFCDEPTTTRALHAEFRASAIQLVLLKDILDFPVAASEFIQNMAQTLACGAMTQLNDAYCIPRRRSETRRLQAMSNKVWEQGDRLRAQGKVEEARDAHRQKSEINAASVSAYRQDRLEYAMKHITKYYLRLSAGELLGQWQDMLDNIDQILHIEDREAA